MPRIYSKSKRRNHDRWHKQYNHEHDYSTKQTSRKRFTREEMFLIWHKRLTGGRVLTDPQIAKLLKRSLQSVQLKRHKMVNEGVF